MAGKREVAGEETAGKEAAGERRVR